MTFEGKAKSRVECRPIRQFYLRNQQARAVNIQFIFITCDHHNVPGQYGQETDARLGRTPGQCHSRILHPYAIKHHQSPHTLPRPVQFQHRRSCPSTFQLQSARPRVHSSGQGTDDDAECVQ